MLCACFLHVSAFHCVTVKQSSSSSVEFPCELMCVPISIIAVGSSVLLILRSEVFFFFQDYLGQKNAVGKTAVSSVSVTAWWIC